MYLHACSHTLGEDALQAEGEGEGAPDQRKSFTPHGMQKLEDAQFGRRKPLSAQEMELCNRLDEMRESVEETLLPSTNEIRQVRAVELEFFPLCNVELTSNLVHSLSGRVN